MNSPTAESSTYASRAKRGPCQSPHVYVAMWIHHKSADDNIVIKVGVSEKARWRAWSPRGCRMLALRDTCCMKRARHIEQHLLTFLAADAAPAFVSAAASRRYLGYAGIGWTECYVVPSRIPERLMDELVAFGFDFITRQAVTA